MGRKHKSFPKGDGESGEIRELKQKIKRLDSDKRRLISELKTLQEALDKTNKFLTKKVEDISVEDLTKWHNKPLKQIEAQISCKKCSSLKYNILTLPGNRKVRICADCHNREGIEDDISDLNSIEEIIQQTND